MQRNNPYYFGSATYLVVQHDECCDLEEISRYTQRSEDAYSRNAPIDQELGNWLNDRSR